MAELSGPLGVELDHVLSRVIEEQGYQRTGRLCLDLSKAGPIDGQGLFGLFRVGHKARHNGFVLICWVAGRHSKAILDCLGLAQVIPLFSSRQNALQALDLLEEPPVDPQPFNEICLPNRWSESLGEVTEEELPPGCEGLNVLGRAIQGPMDGCGKLVLKRYRVLLPGVGESAIEITAVLRKRLTEFWPEGNSIVFGPDGIVPGAVGVIDLTLPGRMPLRTGVRVIHSAPESFTFATLQGHMASGYIDFSVRDGEEGPVVEIASLARTGDPFFNIGFHLFGHVQQERFWQGTISRVAVALGVNPVVEGSQEYLDQSSGSCPISNIGRNAAASTSISILAGVAKALLFVKKRGGSG